MEFEGAADSGILPSIYGSGGRIRISPSPGVELSSAGGFVTCGLPDGGSIVAGGPIAAFAPSGLLAGSDAGAMLSEALRSIDSAELIAGVAAAVADVPGWQGAAVVDLTTGRAAMSGNKGAPVPLAFRLGEGARELEYWPEQEPLEWTEYPEPPPPPPAPPRKAREDGEEGEEETETLEAQADGTGQDEEEEEIDEDGEVVKKAKPPPPPPPPPIHHVNPVASGVAPRIFVIYRSGDGYEVLDRSAFEALHSRGTRASVPAGNGLLAPVELNSRPLAGAKEPGVVVHSLLTQMPQVKTCSNHCTIASSRR